LFDAWRVGYDGVDIKQEYNFCLLHTAP